MRWRPSNCSVNRWNPAVFSSARSAATFREISIPVTHESRGRLERVLGTIGRFVDEGFLPAAPQTGACGYCDYRPVCGPYEEQRARRKQPERLEPLIEIRNLP